MNNQDAKYVLTETHLHTKEVSLCARVPADEIPGLYKDKGYGKIIVTDHWNRWTLDKFRGNWREKNKKWLAGFEIVREHGEMIGMDVFLAMELCITGGPEDFLIYGITEEFIMEHPDLYEYPLNEIYKIVDDSGMLIFQAHPFRPYLHAAKPSYLHGAEVFNGNANHQNNNDKALEFANKNNLLKISGSDFHEYSGVAMGGIYIPAVVKDNNALIECIKNNNYKLYP